MTANHKKTDWHAEFKRLDTKNHGKLNLVEMLAWYRKRDPKFPASKVEEFINKNDKNHDGSLSEVDFVKAMEFAEAHNELPVKKPDWHNTYRCLNKDKDNGLDLVELLAWYRKTFPKCSVDAVEQWMKKHDKDKDGKLNEAEFVA